MEFSPTVLRDVSDVDTGRDILGRRSALPFAFAPTGFTRMMHTEGERAVASVAGEVGIPYTLSTMGTTTIEDVAAAAPGTRKWFQLYLWRDRAPGKDLVERAAAAGYDTLMLTVDTPVGGARLRDVRNGLTIPPSLTLKTFLDGALHPNWWFDFLTTEPLKFASLESTDGTVADLINRVFDPALTMDDVEWLRSTWNGGPQRARAPGPRVGGPPAVDEVGDRAEVMVDTGITHGADIVAAIALGARAALVGRAYLYGLMAGCRTGVAKSVQILTGEIVRTMQLLGVNSVDELRPSHVRLRPNG